MRYRPRNRYKKHIKIGVGLFCVVIDLDKIEVKRNMTDDYKKGIIVLDYLKSIGLDFGTIGEAICDENLGKSYEIILQNPTISKQEFVEKIGIDYDEEEILMHGFLCRLQMHPYQIVEAMDEDNYEKTLEIMKEKPDISRDEFLRIMEFTGKYRDNLTAD